MVKNSEQDAGPDRGGLAPTGCIFVLKKGLRIQEDLFGHLVNGSYGYTCGVERDGFFFLVPETAVPERSIVIRPGLKRR